VLVTGELRLLTGSAEELAKLPSVVDPRTSIPNLFVNAQSIARRVLGDLFEEWPFCEYKRIFLFCYGANAQRAELLADDEYHRGHQLLH
jgi:hypothetical protein